MIDVLEILRNKEAERKEKNIQPSSVLLSELLNACAELIKEELRQAVINGTLECHKTLNDVSFNSKQ